MKQMLVAGWWVLVVS